MPGISLARVAPRREKGPREYQFRRGFACTELVSRPPPTKPRPARTCSGCRASSSKCSAMAARRWSWCGRPASPFDMAGMLTLLAGALPALVAWIGARIVDAVVHAASSSGGESGRCWSWWRWRALAVAAAGAVHARAVAVHDAAARAAGVSRQLDDPRQGADARSGAFRGFGVLRSPDARASRSFAAAAEPGDAQLLAGAEPGVAGELRRAAVRLLALGGGAAGAGWPAGIRGGGASFPTMRSGCSAGVRPSGACRPTWRPSSRARTTPRR